ncbi:hypothetical protein DUNSADRAFT_12039 [Dunaliella salina]|uniref:Encoded protein n=1 Tax=Dunaliella salina TaxID=3046 RepID=A0ABQ7FS10_DUNSA|nr:hypothetical protein DUNSADRAFT_12039 [Dunaliella salina]|eukprot:KAF5825294.1 hypothetical protein DUNSADRAFT_12039 [Dunaliella salina]
MWLSVICVRRVTVLQAPVVLKLCRRCGSRAGVTASSSRLQVHVIECDMCVARNCATSACSLEAVWKVWQQS